MFQGQTKLYTSNSPYMKVSRWNSYEYNVIHNWVISILTSIVSSLSNGQLLVYTFQWVHDITTEYDIITQPSTLGYQAHPKVWCSTNWAIYHSP